MYHNCGEDIPEKLFLDGKKKQKTKTNLPVTRTKNHMRGEVRRQSGFWTPVLSICVVLEICSRINSFALSHKIQAPFPLSVHVAACEY